MVADFFAYVFAIGFAGLAILLGLSVFLVPLWLFSRLFGTGVGIAPPSVKQEVINAQYEYDRTLRRRD